MMKAPNINNKIRVFVHTPSGNIVNLYEVSLKTTIHELKLELEIKTGMLAEIQNILLSSVKLHHTKSLLESNVINGSVLRLKAKEGSLEQIYINAVKGDTKEVFKLGVEYIEQDDNSEECQNDHLATWNKFVPLRAFQALFAAAYSGNIDMMSHLLRKSAATTKMVSKAGRNLLHVAASQGELMSVNFLLSKGVDGKQADNNGKAALPFPNVRRCKVTGV